MTIAEVRTYYANMGKKGGEALKVLDDIEAQKAAVAKREKAERPLSVQPTGAPGTSMPVRTLR